MDGAYCSVSDVKTLLEKKASTVKDDGLLQMLVDGASRGARQFISVDVLSAARTEYRNGTGTGTLMFRVRPVTAVASVKYGQPGQTRTALVLNTDYVWDESAVFLTSGVFTRGVQFWELNYTGGWATTPADLKLAVATWAASKFRELDRLGQTSKSLGGEVINFDTKAMPSDVKRTLEAYQPKVPL